MNSLGLKLMIDFHLIYNDYPLEIHHNAWQFTIIFIRWNIKRIFNDGLQRQ